jgi:hypothetical protein
MELNMYLLHVRASLSRVATLKSTSKFVPSSPSAFQYVHVGHGEHLSGMSQYSMLTHLVTSIEELNF